MATLADELLNDFEDSDPEGDGEHANEFHDDEAERPSNGLMPHQNGITDMDMEDEDGEDEDEAMDVANAVKTEGLEAGDDEEEAKAKVEKMELGGVKDVRSVAGLMKKLEPVLEVSLPFHHPVWPQI